EGQWDGIILAEASLDRLGITNVARWRLDPTWFTPAPAQGALAIETRDGDPLAAWLDGVIGDATTRLCVTIEREVLARLGGDCTMPFAAYARDDGTGRMDCEAVILARSGKNARVHRVADRKLGAKALADLVCE